MENKDARAWREEKVFIAFHEHGARLQALLGRKVGDWVVTPKDKPVSRGQTVRWQTVPEADLELFLPEVFEPSHVKGKGQATAAVRPDATPGYYLYEAYCDGELATGGSSPGMIVDP